jgi:hypothetical protein
MLRKTTLAALLSLAALAISPPAFADFEAGQIASQDGNLTLAASQWETSARLGELRSQRALGLLLRDGRGVVQDYVAAHMWLNLAAAQGDAEAARERDALARRMSVEQVAEAQKRALAFKPNAPTDEAAKVDQATVAAAPVESVTEAPLDRKTAPATPVSSPLAGLWMDKRNGFIMSIEPVLGGSFVMKEALLDDKYNFPGDVIGEFRINEIGDGYAGRHIWGGKRKGDVRWSAEGAMLVSLNDARSIQVKYTDSKYSDGWLYEKIK